jgi:hypothetical protein
MLLLVDKLPYAVASACLLFARVRFPTRVKALLGFADADHGDTRGCHFLLGGVLLGRTAPPSMLGETLGPLCRTG